jgi:hypothetical protein
MVVRVYCGSGSTFAMKRISLLVLVVAFLAGPALNLRCLLSCAPLHATAPPAEGCQHSTGPNQTVSPAGDCGVRLGAVPALASKRVSLTSFAFVLTNQTSVELPTYQPPETSSVSRLSVSPPLSSLLIPLRI